MGNRRTNETKNIITDTAWRLFCEYGYENVTLEDILEAAHISRGTFYYHFDGKDSVLLNISYIFDEDYTVIENTLPTDVDEFEQLMYVNYEFFRYLELRVPVEMLSRVLSIQLTSGNSQKFYSRNRVYQRLCRKIIESGQRNGVFRSDMTISEIINDFAVAEWGILYSWAFCKGNFPLASYAKRRMPFFMASYLKTCPQANRIPLQEFKRQDLVQRPFTVI